MADHTVFPPDKRVFSRQQAATYLGMSMPTLTNREREGTGPVREDVGPRTTVYLRTDLDAYIDAHGGRAALDRRRKEAR